MSVYENIDYIIKQRHISRRKLALMAGIKPTTLASCFSRRPEHFPNKYVVAIANALEVDVEEIVGTQKNDSCLDMSLIPKEIQAAIRTIIDFYTNNHAN